MRDSKDIKSKGNYPASLHGEMKRHRNHPIVITNIAQEKSRGKLTVFF